MGGEGTVEALAIGMGGELVHVSVTGPLGDPVTAEYGILKADGTRPKQQSSKCLQPQGLR